MSNHHGHNLAENVSPTRAVQESTSDSQVLGGS